MPRTVLRDLGFVILFASAFIGLLPVIASSFAIGASWPEGVLAIGNHELFRVSHLTNANAADVAVTSWVWVTAALGELMMLAAWLMKVNVKQHASAHVVG